MRRVRKMTVVLWVWCLAILAWVIAGAASSAHYCSQYTDQSACNAGRGIGALLILFIGFVGFCFFTLIWFMTKPKEGR